MLCTTGSFYAKSDTFQSNISHVAKLFPLPMKLQAFGSFLVELINISALYFCRPAVFLSLTFIEMDRSGCLQNIQNLCLSSVNFQYLETIGSILWQRRIFFYFIAYVNFREIKLFVTTRHTNPLSSKKFSGKRLYRRTAFSLHT